ncbi:DegT/DnrJ/EryC1/StrS family aminotransferase [Deinococcus sp. SL84]|uniref:DegT/DnrJ/EryC1/StrS family aminotransferase n=1 Tax=Deinococcus sp. SL84 TaxID=2994663 RepID=UPI0022724C0B|nr:DegT/DnrJ/EryC1/StrS family aminotransferase [Deinococcus sp. SL84]MCY1704064.1 DegT/DnrJ/EryC1/StrS family aminotransferase [Deinococcus sp. SL84]
MTQTITKTATDPATQRLPTLFYRSAREGMQDFLNQPSVLPDPAAGVLLPAFIGWSPREGSGVFDPVRNLAVRAGFYDLNPDLTVDLAKLEAELQKGYRVLVLIHYYGRTESKLREVRELADRYGALLVEDLAHGFYSALLGGVAGSLGDINLYSLHKMFPTPDAQGGMIAYRNQSLLDGQQETAPELARFILNYDWAAISAARRRNAGQILDALRELPECGQDFELLWPEIAAGDVPQTLPIRILRGNRDHIYHAMNEDGYGMVSLYHTLIEPVRGDFAEMVALSKSVINFPVHQDLDPVHIPDMLASFQKALHASKEQA